ncbi:MAG TPA: type IV toxin-antitoxin system AbiEi family antitoxin domain-containing protein [Spirochaetota bacterium]|nr:type IV toxin-antitoxin system AbiEi family antitoxin domain-containing protein [Spirochaetota bacterium]
MKLTDILFHIHNLGQPVIRTSDLAAYLNIDKSRSSKILTRLEDSGHLVRIKRGTWLYAKDIDPLAVTPYLTAPFPSCISLQSALYYHGIISQIPEIIYSVSPARSIVYEIPNGIYSVHHIAPLLFKGYEIVGKYNIKIAFPEKALFDFAYFFPVRTKLFRSLPETDIPKDLDQKKIENYISLIKSASRRTMVYRLIGEML